MGFKLTLEVDVDTSPDAIGECLRSNFFEEETERSRRLGCYETFDWRSDVVPFPGLPMASDPDLTWIRGKLRTPGGQVECRYYWDGDGTLAFHLPDGRWLVNTDCKKDHGWKLYDSEEEF